MPRHPLLSEGDRRSHRFPIFPLSLFNTTVGASYVVFAGKNSPAGGLRSSASSGAPEQRGLVGALVREETGVP
jgi:hypothetical protein